MNRNDLGRLIARLAVAVIAADGRITTAELAALARVDDLDLGPLSDVAREEIERAIHGPEFAALAVRRLANRCL